MPWLPLGYSYYSKYNYSPFKIPKEYISFDYNDVNLFSKRSWSTY